MASGTETRRRHPRPSQGTPVGTAAPDAGLTALVLAAAFVFVGALQVHRLDDADTWWHLATGRLIVATGSVPATDPFSYTAAGAPWMNRQWLYELGLFGLWRAGGPAAVILGSGAMFVVGFACIARLVGRRMPAWASAALVFLAAEAAVERFTVRPEAASLCFLGLELLLLDGAVTARTAVALAGLQVVWANVHALSVLGLVPLGAELASALAARSIPLPAGWRAASARPRPEIVYLALATAGALVAQAATPFGVRGAVYPLRLLELIRGSERLSFTIVEHRATVLGELSPATAFGLIALLGLAVVAAVVSVRRWRLGHVACAAAFAALAFMARRNVGLMGFGVLPLVAGGLGPGACAVDAWLRGRSWAHRAVMIGMTAALLLGTARVVTGEYYLAARLTRAFGLGEPLLLFPSGAVDFLEAEAPDARVFNDDMLGGYLLWRAFPPRQVFFDGRLQVYPPSVYADYQDVLDDPARFAEVAARWHVTAAILHHPSPGRIELAATIARLPGWRVAFVDGGGIVLLADGKPAAPPAGAIGPTPAIATTGLGATLERALGGVRPPAEQAIAHYQRGRALLTLFGRGGAIAARGDFEEALHLWPSCPMAAEGRRVALQVERQP